MDIIDIDPEKWLYKHVTEWVVPSPLSVEQPVGIIGRAMRPFINIREFDMPFEGTVALAHNEIGEEIIFGCDIGSVEASLTVIERVVAR